MNNNELLKYLSEEDKKRIAEKVYEEEIRKEILKDINEKSPTIFNDKSFVYTRILDQYIEELDLYHSDFIEPFKAQLKEEIEKIIEGKSTEDDKVTLRTVIEWAINDLGRLVIEESKEELKPIIKEKVFKCCNETLLIAFLSDIVRGMNLNEAVKKLIQESEGDKV